MTMSHEELIKAFRRYSETYRDLIRLTVVEMMVRDGYEHVSFEGVKYRPTELLAALNAASGTCKSK